MPAEVAGADHGAALIDRVVAHLRTSPELLRDFDGRGVPGMPVPMSSDVLAAMSFPSGRPLPPSLRRWLAFDAGWLAEGGWLTDDLTAFTPRALSEIVREEYGYEPEDLGDGTQLDATSAWQPLDELFSECFLLPGGSDSRRVLAVTEPDAWSEYPVLATDNDEDDWLGVMYPGLDVFLAELVGVIEFGEFDFCTDLADHPVCRDRMTEHIARPPFEGNPDGLSPWDLDDPS